MNKHPLIIDIETVPQTVEQIRAMVPPFNPQDVKTGNLKDPEKVKAKIAEEEKAYWDSTIERAALYCHTGRLAMLGLVIAGALDLSSGDDDDWERFAIGRAFECIDTALGASMPVVGYNIKEFDIPFLIRRGWRYGLRPPQALRAGRYWNDGVIDLWERWTMSFRPDKGTSSLDLVARYFGLPPSEGDGADFYKMTLEQQKAHCARDLRNTESLYKILCGAL